MTTKHNIIAILVILTLGIATSVSLAQNSKRTAVLLEQTQLGIKSNGASSGSVTLNPGKEVEILEEAGTNYKVGIQNFAEGWVDASKLEITQSPDQTPIQEANQPSQNAPEVNEANVSADETVGNDSNQQSNAPVSNNWDGKEPKISATITEEVEREYSSPDGCKGKRVANVISVQVDGFNPEKLNNSNIKTYAVLNTEHLDVTVVNGVTTRLAPIEVKELTQKDSDGASLTYSHSQNNNECSCCRKRKKQHLSGFYTEITAQDGTVLTSYMSDLKRKDRVALEEYLGRKPNRNL